MRVMVLGASGFIGRAVCAELEKAGHEVCRHPHDRPLNDVPRDHLPQAVVNLAGENMATQAWTADAKRAFRESRVGLTEHLTTWLVASPHPPALVNCSAVGFYGDRGDTLLTEADPEGTGFTATLCAAWERAALTAAEHGVRVCVVRPGLVLDADGGGLARLRDTLVAGQGRITGDGRRWVSWIARPDLARMVRWAIEDDSAIGVHNAVAPHPVRHADLIGTLAGHLGARLLPPRPAAEVQAAMGEAAELALSSQRVHPRRALAAGFSFEHPQLRPAVRALLGIQVGGSST